MKGGRTVILLTCLIVVAAAACSSDGSTPPPTTADGRQSTTVPDSLNLPTLVPTTALRNTQLTVPPLGSVSGGGPLGGGDPLAATRLQAQLTRPVGQYYQADGSAAVGYFRTLIDLVPTAKAAFSILNQVISCATSQGVAAARAYVAQTLASAGAMLVLSHDQLSRIGQIALACLLSYVTGGGPGGPCFDRYYYTAPSANLTYRYDVYVVATSAATCSDIEAFHKSEYSLHPL